MEPTSPDAPPVFVDDSGRRCWIVRILGRLIATATIGFVVLVGVAVGGSPSVDLASAPATPAVHAPARHAVPAVPRP
jgi:hypothetical protein